MNSSDRIQPSPRATEPAGDIFIDRGMAVPDVYPGDRLRVHARDPHTVFVYWEAQDPGEHGWHLILKDAGGLTVASFDTPPGHHRSGYVQVDDIGRVAGALLMRRQADGSLRAVARLALQLRVREPDPGGPHAQEHWVDVRTGTIGSGSPGQGRVESLGFARASEVRSSAAIVGERSGFLAAEPLAGDDDDDTAEASGTRQTPWYRRKRGLPEPTQHADD